MKRHTGDDDEGVEPSRRPVDGTDQRPLLAPGTMLVPLPLPNGS